MANWKKVIVSGSNAELTSITSSVLTNDNLLVAGTGGAIENSGITYNGTTVALGSSSITSTGTGTVLTGSFAGSFSGSVVVDLQDLTQGTGITAFTYDGNATATVAVSGASALSSDTVTKWTGAAFANTTITDDGTTVTFTEDAVFNKDITVLGTASFQNTTNLEVADRFVLFASGSNTPGDGGIVVQQDTQDVGELFGYNAPADRWGLTGSFTANQSSFTPDAFMAAVVSGSSTDPTTAPARYQVGGNIFIGTDENIWIYS
jgi:hypothetical protein